MFERSILKMVDFARGTWQLALEQKGSTVNINGPWNRSKEGFIRLELLRSFLRSFLQYFLQYFLRWLFKFFFDYEVAIR